MSKYYKNKEGRVFQATENLSRNRSKLGLVECDKDGKTAYQENDEVSALRARIAELEAEKAGKAESEDTEKDLSEFEGDLTPDSTPTPETVELENLTPQQKAAATRAANRAKNK